MDKSLEKLLQVFGIAGHENEVRDFLKEELKNIDCAVKEDKMGNFIVRAGRSSQKLMFVAHMDCMGLMVNNIDDNGLVQAVKIGNYKAEELSHAYIKFENGTLGISGECSKDGNSIFIDLGVSSKEEALAKVSEGDVAAFVGPALDLKDYIVSPNLHNRAACYIMLQLIKEAVNSNKELYFVFSTQGEVAGRGGRAAAFLIDPAYCIVLDAIACSDKAHDNRKINLSEGPVVSIMDKNLISNKEVLDMILKASEEAGVPVQRAITDCETEAGAIQKEKYGVKVGTVLLPVRYKNTMSEMVALKDMDNTIALLKKLL